MYEKTITVNELDMILEKHFKIKNIYIKEVRVASIENQHKPINQPIGIGGICSITFESSRKIRIGY